jgi:hypothetical protein
MNRMIAFAALTLAFGIAVPDIAAAQTAKDLVGTWNEVSNVNIHPDGSRADVFVPGSKGVIIFDSNGHYASVTLNAILPKFASGNRNTGTPEENKAIVQGSLSHFGTYTVADKVITLKVDGSTWPAWTGTDQKRTIISFMGDDIKWSLAASIGGTSEIAWKRVK